MFSSYGKFGVNNASFMNFYRLRVDRCMIQPIERIQPENEKLHAELAESFGWRENCARSRRGCMRF